jgi:hypothetical protein
MVRPCINSSTLCAAMFPQLLKTAALATVVFRFVRADLPIYTDGNLASGWENWSWGSDINFAATDLFEGTSSMSVNSTQWAALSVKLEGNFQNYAGLRFDIAVRDISTSAYETLQSNIHCRIAGRSTGCTDIHTIHYGQQPISQYTAFCVWKNSHRSLVHIAFA